MTRIHELLQLPESVRKGDFVQSLSGGIDNPDATVATYAVTPAILALGLLVFLRAVRPWHIFAVRLLLLQPDCCF
mgnify:CR=1 FL=1